MVFLLVLDTSSMFKASDLYLNMDSVVTELVSPVASEYLNSFHESNFEFDTPLFDTACTTSLCDLDLPFFDEWQLDSKVLLPNNQQSSIQSCSKFTNQALNTPIMTPLLPFDDWLCNSTLLMNSQSPLTPLTPMLSQNLNSLQTPVLPTLSYSEQNVSLSLADYHLLLTAALSLQQRNLLDTNASMVPFHHPSVDADDKSSEAVETTHICPFPGCGKSFFRKFNRDTHALIHNPYRPRSFKCGDCDMTFIRQHDLARHQVVHDKSRSYECTVCIKKFSRSDALARHQKKKGCLVFVVK